MDFWKRYVVIWLGIAALSTAMLNGWFGKALTPGPLGGETACACRKGA